MQRLLNDLNTALPGSARREAKPGGLNQSDEPGGNSLGPRRCVQGSESDHPGGRFAAFLQLVQLLIQLSNLLLLRLVDQMSINRSEHQSHRSEARIRLVRLCIASAVNFLVSSGIASTGVAVAMEQFPFSQALEIAELEPEALLL